MKPDQIKRLRYNIYHLSQPEFAEVMGVCVATISRWEAGRTKPVAMAKVILEACQQAVDSYGEERIRGVDWSGILQRGGLLKVLYGILAYATTSPQPPLPVDDDALV